MQTCKTNNCSVDSAAKSASENTCSYCSLHTKGVVLHVATYIQEMSKVVPMLWMSLCSVSLLMHLVTKSALL